jgi:hypothetical protein
VRAPVARENLAAPIRVTGEVEVCPAMRANIEGVLVVAECDDIVVAHTGGPGSGGLVRGRRTHTARARRPDPIGTGRCRGSGHARSGERPIEMASELALGILVDATLVRGNPFWLRCAPNATCG